MKGAEQTALEAAIRDSLVRADHTAAATRAIEGYGPELVGFLIAICRNEDDGYEVFSQLSEDLWRGIGGFRQECSFRTWCYKLAWHAAQRFRRDGFRKRARHAETDELCRIVAESRTSTRPHLRTSVKEGIAALRERLKPEDQSLLILRVDRGLSWEEVAAVLSTEDRPLEIPTLWKRYRRLQNKLRKLADEAGLLPD